MYLDYARICAFFMDILQKKTPGLETPFYALEKEKLLTTNITKTIILYFCCKIKAFI